jgi:hypothetical protein
MDATTIKEAKKQVKDARKQAKRTVRTDGAIGGSVGVLGTLRSRPNKVGTIG